MKKMFVILILVNSWLVSSAQLQPPVQPYNESGYSNNDFERFALKNTKLSESYKDELLSMVRDFLDKSGLNTKYELYRLSDDELVHWIFMSSRTWAEHRDGKTDKRYSNPDGFWNTRQNSTRDGIDWFLDKNNFEGLVLVLHVDGYQLDIAKTICMNLLSVPYRFPEKNQTSNPVVNQNQEVVKKPFDYGDNRTEPKVDIGLDDTPPVKEKSKFKAWIIPIAVAIMAAGITYTIFHNHKNIDNHNSGSVRSHPTPTPVEDTGPTGPTGAPPN